MREVSVYYCWACDAHRRIAATPDGKARCPRCQHELTPDARLPVPFARSSTLEESAKIVWPAPIRPRLAA